jgi:hypothetical protein
MNRAAIHAILPSMKRQVCCVMLALGLLHASRLTVTGQEVAGSFDQLRVLVKPGDAITVVNDAGKELRGTIADLSSTSLGLVVDGKRLDLRATDVDAIRQRRSDTLANGAKVGFGIGAALGLLGGLAIMTELDGGEAAGVVVAATLFYGGVGAGIGVGVDAMIARDQVIFARRTASAARIAVQPMFTRHRQGAVLVIGF